MAEKKHYWHAPTIPVGTPTTATVVVQSDCGIRYNIPVWGLDTWRAKSNPHPAAEDTCENCLRMQSMQRHPASQN